MLYISEDIVGRVRSWSHYSLMTGLSKARSEQEAREICEIFFQNLEHRFRGMKSVDIVIFDILFQKL
jgi:hypothetical protein